MHTSLSQIDLAVIVLYLLTMLALGIGLSRRKASDEDYFLGGRRMPWFAVGISVIASLLSSLTYLSEPGEVWKSGMTHMVGKMLAIPLEMAIVWLFFIPFLMRFRFTSAYEYLEARFGFGARRLGVGLFLVLVVLWMGFVVFASAKALAAVIFFDPVANRSIVENSQLFAVIGTIGVVATLYTMLGGMRAVIWTDVIQVAILVGGGLLTVGYVAWATGSGIGDWYNTASDYLSSQANQEPFPWFSLDPTVRVTVITVAINMCVWHICTHVANQMTVQRYFSTSDVKAARRSFVTGSLMGVVLNLMLAVVGLAVLHYYVSQTIPLDRGLSVEKDRDLIFPTFAVSRLPPGVGGAILAALLAAAMSSIDSGINSIATVLTVELRGTQPTTAHRDNVPLARTITLVAGLFITIAACALTYLPEKWGIVGAMPRTFNAVTAPLGGLFLIGMFFPRVGEFGAIAATACGLLTSLFLGYIEQIEHRLHALGWTSLNLPDVSFTWIMPSALAVTLGAALLFGALSESPRRDLRGLTWYTRKE